MLEKNKVIKSFRFRGHSLKRSEIVNRLTCMKNSMNQIFVKINYLNLSSFGNLQLMSNIFFFGYLELYFLYVFNLPQKLCTVAAHLSKSRGS